MHDLIVYTYEDRIPFESGLSVSTMIYPDDALITKCHSFLKKMWTFPLLILEFGGGDRDFAFLKKMQRTLRSAAL